MRAINLALRFVLEVAVLAGLFLFGIRATGELIVDLVLGIGLPVAVGAIWGTFVSPKAPRRLDDPVRLVVEVVIFGLGAVVWVAADALIVGVILGVAAAISLVLMLLWDQRGA